MTGKKWALSCLFIALALALLIGCVVVWVDPFFHYTGPRDGISYQFKNELERQLNYGIAKRYSYDAVITGTSMTENFKATEFDELFDATTIKAPFYGSSFREINDFLTYAFDAHPDIRYVVQSLDLTEIIKDKDELNYSDYPTYLYDHSLLNDVNYIFNKDAALWAVSDVLYTLRGGRTTGFDDYGNWMDDYTFSTASALATYRRPEAAGAAVPLTEEEKAMTRENITENLTSLAQAHPDTTFYLFFPPYSILAWDSFHQEGTLERQLQAHELVTELLLPYDNIRVFSFIDIDVITDLDRYKDWAHYDEDLNSQFLFWMRDGTYELTEDNYQDYYDRARAFFMSYDYDGLFE